MMLQRKTEIGTLMARYNQNETYPGFWIDLKRICASEIPICNIEYDKGDNCIKVIVYGNKDTDEPTHVIDIKV